MFRCMSLNPYYNSGVGFSFRETSTTFLILLFKLMIYLCEMQFTENESLI